MTKLHLVAFAAFATMPAALNAQSMDVSLRGFRIEANAGVDRFGSADTHRSKFGYGATAGVDANVGPLVVGVEGSYWRDSNKPVNCLTGDAGTFCSTAYGELGAAVRAGFAISPALLVFGKAGVVRTREREVFTSAGGPFYVDGEFVPAPPSTDIRFSESGYELGGGAEFALSPHVYANAQYVYSHYRDRTTRSRVMAGVGYRF